MASLGFAPGPVVATGWTLTPVVYSTSATPDPAVETFLSRWTSRTRDVPAAITDPAIFQTADPMQDPNHDQHKHMRRLVTAIAISIAIVALFFVLGAIFIIIRRRRASKRQHEEGELKDLSPHSTQNLRIGRAELPSAAPIIPETTIPQRHNSTYGSGIDYSAVLAEGESQPAARGYEVDNPADPPPPYQPRASGAGARSVRSDADNASVISEMGAREVQTRQMV